MTIARWGRLGVLLLLLAPVGAEAQTARADTPQDLLALAREFREWRRATSGLAPDYAAVVATLRKDLPTFQRRLEALRRDDWPVSTKVDFLVVRSELNEIDFDLRVMRPWSRNPHYYVEEAVAAARRPIGGRYQMGPGVTVPYDVKRAEAIIAGLERAPKIVEQAKRMLTEPVGEMGDAALEVLTDIRPAFQEFGRVVSPHVPESHRARLVAAAEAAGAALAGYRDWITSNRARMTAPYAIGRPAFDWYVRHVLMLPYDSDQLLMQAQQERDRGWAFLAMERQKNRRLPALSPAPTNARYSEWKDATDVLAREWAEEHELFTRPDHVGAMRHYGDGVCRRRSPTRRRHGGRLATVAPTNREGRTEASDGVPLAGFLLTPTTGGGPRPALLALHTNSYGQFYDHWAPFYHYLAQSGYVVLQLDQRGSSGYGRAFRDLAIGTWGTRTSDDVTDAAAWLRRRPEVDPARIGVVGFSFGAYLTLMAMTRTPGTFQAGVAIMGVADRRPPFASRNAVFHIGRSPEEAPALYERISPIASVASLRDPLLVIHSDADLNVPPEQTYRLQDALERAGVPHEVVVYPGEAHGLALPAHQLDSYRRIEQFLARALGAARRPASTPAPADRPAARPGENRRD